MVYPILIHNLKMYMIKNLYILRSKDKNNFYKMYLNRSSGTVAQSSMNDSVQDKLRSSPYIEYSFG